jgi:hypothetical protein
VTSAWIWAAAVAVYAAFRAWYDNWRGPVTQAEVDAFLAGMRGTPSAEHNDLEILRRFLLEDDGREFFMVNLVKVQQGDAVHPEDGRRVPARALMQHYMRAFVPALLRRGGHPAIAARKIGGYVDAWRVTPDPGWTIVGYMRYRCRRDLMALVADPRFLAMHPYKIAATAETFSFPSRPLLTTMAGPRIWVAMVLALLASAAQIAVLLAR